MSGMSAWVTSDTTRWRRALTGSVRKSMAVTRNPPQARGFVYARPRAPSAVQAIRPAGAYMTIRMRVLSEPQKVTPSGNVIQLCPTLANRKRDPVAGGCGFAGRPSDRTPGRHVTGLLYRWGLRWGHPKVSRDLRAPKSDLQRRAGICRRGWASRLWVECSRPVAPKGDIRRQDSK